MEKNLKIKVKNAQLAAALRQNKEKREKENNVKAREPLVKPKEAIRKKREVPRSPSMLHAPSEKVATSKVDEAENVRSTSSRTKDLTSKESAECELKAKPKDVESKKKKKESDKVESLKELKKRDKEREALPEKGKEESGLGRNLRELRKYQNIHFDTRDRQGLRVGEERTWRQRRSRYKVSKPPVEVVRPKELSVHIPISVKDLAQAMKLKASELISKLFMQGIAVTINDLLDDVTTIQLLGHEFSCDISIDTSEEQRLRITSKTIQEEIQETDASDLQSRAPVIAFMGHVDHGKTSLIDIIRKSSLAREEAGDITQHIGAFTYRHEQGMITILDTPGHEAFKLMRQRGAAITDILILVIAGDEGIMPQTDESISLAKKASIPLIVAINKCDKPAFDSDNVHRQLADRELLPEVWGGSVITVNCSATTGEGISQLLDMIILQAEMMELKANPHTRARGTVLESQLHRGFGPVATVLVQNGTLKRNHALVFEDVYARVKTMYDEHGMALTTVGPSVPVKITGMSGVPQAGCEFIAVKNEKIARKLTEDRTSGHKHTSLQQHSRGEFEVLLSRQQELAEKKILNIILRVDVQGSIEAIRNALLAIKTTKIELNFISEGVGEVSESDVELALVFNAIIICFHTQVESHAEELIKHSSVIIRRGDIIYQIIDDIKELMLAALDKVRQEIESGTARVKQIFKASQVGAIAGCIIIDGIVKRNQLVKVFRENNMICEGTLTSLKRVKEDVKEVGKGLECGIVLDLFNDYQEEDLIKTFDIHYVQPTL